MFEESVSILSIWASMNSWFTPNVLFVFLNIMIWTIFFTSIFANQNQHHQQQTQDDHQQPPARLVRSPSLLQRLKSVNLYSYRSQGSTPLQSITTHFKLTPDSDTHFPQEQTHLQQTLETETSYVSQQIQEQETQKTETQYVPEQTPHENEEEQHTMDEIYSQLVDRHVNRTNSDTKPASGEVTAKLPTKMRKSASIKLPFGHFEEEDIVESLRPATMREGKERVTEADDEVDAKADDFINKFKQQLKLQRRESLLRDKELIGRGSGK